MYPVFLLCLSNLKKRKIQNGIIAIIIMLSTLLLSTAVVVMNNTGEVFTDVHNKVNGSHEILYFENGLYDPDRVHDWWAEQKGVTASSLFHYRSLSTFTYQGKEVSNINLYMMDSGTAPNQTKVDQLIFAQGTKTEVPSEGTTWIPTSLAYSKAISVGDEIGVKTDTGQLKLKVSALVVDIPFSQPFSITARIWLNTNDYAHSMAVNGQVDKAIMGLRFDNLNDQGVYWTRFEAAFGAPFLESLTDFQGISSFYLITGKILSFIMILLATIMIMIALYTIGFTISDAILSSYKTIGIVRSSGLSAKKVISVYVLQYFLLAFISIIPGVLLSYPFSKKIITMSLSYLKTNDYLLSINFTIYGILVGISVLTLIGFISLLFSLKSRTIQPAQAIRYGMSETQLAKSAKRLIGSRLSHKWLDRIPVTVAVAIRGLVKNRGGSFLMALITALTTAVLVTGVIFMSSISSLAPPQWGFDNADISLEILNQSELGADELKQVLSEDQRVGNISFSKGLYGVIPIDLEMKSENNTAGVYINSIGGNLDELGLTNIAGRNPQGKNEISIGTRVSKALNKGVGESIDVYVQGRKGTYTISGVYQAITNSSISARMTLEAMDKLQLDSNPGNPLVLLNLNSNVSKDQFIQDFSKKYGTAIYIASQETLIKETFSQAVAVLIMPMLTMGLFIIIVVFSITFSINRIYVKKESKTYGIYKTIGMSSNRIRVSIAFSTLILVAIGVIIGVPIGIYIFPVLLNTILSNYGIVQFPINYDFSMLFFTLFVMVIAVVWGSWIASKMIQKTSLRLLISE
ncbi:hypothetical protein GCM10010912_38870 [Paenibacillus albidus]|uniref:ABC3 transporter permease C-terminal domain-containing protein n=1 Tax=Paenibacillus albidus TaxID=2041023 RepID=A0A917CIR1_9BACL|nr:FtsX-like permease family protein [Paenibacillus albidus]GGF89909.1 hypothetical protein GCM10010912_38870 [Paenibacillus albidus]